MSYGYAAFDPLVNGQGFYIYPGDKYTIYWYTFGNRGALQWYYMRGPENNMTVYTRKAGVFDGVSKEPLQAIGTAWLKDNKLVYDTTEHIMGAIDLRVIAHGIKGSGSFFDVTRNGSGFSVMRMSEDHIAMGWYTYDRMGKQMWLACQGSPDLMGVYQYYDGAFRYPQGELVQIGTASLKKDVFSYEINSNLIRAVGTLTLTEL